HSMPVGELLTTPVPVPLTSLVTVSLNFVGSDPPSTLTVPVAGTGLPKFDFVSLIFSSTVCLPPVEYLCVTVSAAGFSSSPSIVDLTASSEPSPNFQISSRRKPSSSVDSLALKVTVSPAFTVSSSPGAFLPFIENLAIGSLQPVPLEPKVMTL